MSDWSKRLDKWIIHQDTCPVHVLRYEDLQTNTVAEVEKVLNFVNVTYDPNLVKERLMRGYSEFHRPHRNSSYEHYSLEQKQLLRSAMIKVIKSVEGTSKDQLLRLDEYLLTINDH